MYNNQVGPPEESQENKAMKLSFLDTLVLLNALLVTMTLFVVLQGLGVSDFTIMSSTFLTTMVAYGVQELVLVKVIHDRKKAKFVDENGFPLPDENGKVKMDPVNATMLYAFSMLSGVLVGTIVSSLAIGMIVTVALAGISMALASIKVSLAYLEALDDDGKA